MAMGKSHEWRSQHLEATPQPHAAAATRPTASKARALGGLFRIRPWMAAKAHSPRFCAGIKGGGAAASEGCGAQ